jgi:hypothetical protein
MSYCAGCRKKTPDIERNVFLDERLNKPRSECKCADCGTKKCRFISMKDLDKALDESVGSSKEAKYVGGSKYARVAKSEDDYSDEYSEEESDEEDDEEDDESEYEE